LLTQVVSDANAIAVLWGVTVLGVLVCGLLFLAFRD
jgi:hypothetical protein